MNALVSLDSILEPVAALTPTTIFAPGGVEAIISKIETEVRAEVFDVASPAGRERIKSVAYKIARSKTTLDDMGKDLVADIKKQSAAIDKERKTVRDRLDALKEEVRGPLTAWEEAEEKRVADHEAALVQIVQAPTILAGKTSTEIVTLKAHLENLAGRDWQEFGERAVAAFADVMPKICDMRDAAIQREHDQAELEALRKEKAEREARQQEEAAEQERQRQAQERAEREAREAEARAELERQRKEQAERDQAAAVERAREEERQRAECAQVEAIAAERRRQEQEAAAAAAKKAAEEAAERKRQENKRHRAKINNEICADLIAAGVPNDSELVQGIVKAIVAGSIRHVSIQY